MDQVIIIALHYSYTNFSSLYSGLNKLSSMAAALAVKSALHVVVVLDHFHTQALIHDGSISS